MIKFRFRNAKQYLQKNTQCGLRFGSRFLTPKWGIAIRLIYFCNIFFSVPRLCGSRQVVAHCRADERILQMQLLCPALGSQKWRKDNYTVQCQVRPKRKTRKTKQTQQAKTTQEKTKTKNRHQQHRQKRGPWLEVSKGAADASELGSCRETNTKHKQKCKIIAKVSAKHSTQQRRNPGSPLPGSRRSRREALQA